MTHQILLPALALVLLTFAVWTLMGVQRLRFLVANRISPRRISTPEQLNSVIPEHINRPSNNLKNLFEMPVIFYFACAASLVLPQDDAMLIGLAWVYVVLRVVHSAIHCTRNNVQQRFAAYVASCIVLIAMVARLVVAML